MSDKKLLVVLGVTGLQGGSVAKVFGTDPNWRIRGVTRNPSKASNAHLIEAGIELVGGDLDDSSSLEKAFQGADAIFSVTDFWQFLQNPDSPIHMQAKEEDRQPNLLAMEHEVRQGKSIIDAAAKAHAQHPLHRFVLSTLADSNTWSQGEITHNLHFDGKDHYCQYLKQTYPSLAQVSSYVQVGYYLSNAFSLPFWSPHKDPKGPEGQYILPTSTLPNGHPIPFVNPPHDMGYFVEALVNRTPSETTMLGYCELMNYEQYAQLWGKTLGVKARLQHLDYEAMLGIGLPEWMAQEVTESGKFASKYGWTGGEAGVKGPEECGVDMGKLTNVETWIQEQDWKLGQ